MENNIKLERTGLVELIRREYVFAAPRAKKKIVISSNDLIYFYKDDRLINFNTLDGYSDSNLKLTESDKYKLERLYYKVKVDLEELRKYKNTLESKKLKANIDKMCDFYYDVIKRNFVVRDMFFNVSKEGEILLTTKVIL